MAPAMPPVAFVRHVFAMVNFDRDSANSSKKTTITWSEDGSAVVIPNVKHFVDKVLRRPDFFGPNARLNTFLELLWQHGFKSCVDEFYPTELQAPRDGGYPLCFRHEAFTKQQGPAGLGRVRKNISRPEAHKIRVEMDRVRRAISKRKATTRPKIAPKRPRVKSPTTAPQLVAREEEQPHPANNPTLTAKEGSVSMSTIEWLDDLLNEDLVTTPDGPAGPVAADTQAVAETATAMSIDSDENDAWFAAANRLPSPLTHVPSEHSSLYDVEMPNCMPGDLGHVAVDLEQLLQEFDSEDAWETLVEDAHDELFGAEEQKTPDSQQQQRQQRRFVQVHREVGLPFPLPYITVETAGPICQKMAGLRVSYRGAAPAA